MTEGELQIEQRKAPRWKCSINVKFKIVKEEKLGVLKDIFIRYKEGESRDISAGGTQLVSKEPLKVGDKLTMSIYLPATDNTVKALGEVVRVIEKEEDGVKKYFIGIQYVDIITESDDILEEIMDQKLRTGTAGTKMSKEEALKLARYEYFIRLINEESFNFRRNKD
ncbi:MAG: PilZ domain-containing protein [Candidatus Firestonebacteria bacterium]